MGHQGWVVESSMRSSKGIKDYSPIDYAIKIYSLIDEDSDQKLKE